MTDPNELLAILPRTLHRLTVDIRSRLVTGFQAAGIGVSLPESQILEQIAAGDGITAAQLAVATGRDKAMMTRVIAALTAADLVARQMDARDQRCQRLYATPAGQALARQLGQIRQQVYASVFVRLMPVEQAQLQQLLARCLPAD